MATTALSWEEIVERGKQHNKTVICEVDQRGPRRYFKIKCDICGLEAENRIECFMRCESCNRYNRRNGIDNFIIRAKKIHGDKYKYDFAEYINRTMKIKILCIDCNMTFEQSPCSHLDGKGCYVCSVKNKKLTLEQFIIKAKYLHSDKYNYDLVKYVNNKIKVEMSCNNCHKIFKQLPRSHLSGVGCPFCKKSKGENKTAKYLSKNNINFSSFKSFAGLKYINPLRFDFYLSELNLLIEYDGKGHYLPCFGSTPEEKQKNLEDCQLRDKIKTEWAKANNISLLRIPYWDFDRIEELIEAFILQHSKKKEIKQLVLEM
jgi:very-short-patch-repair endonuclease